MSEPRIVSLLEITAFSEKKMLSVPSVTMNGGRFSRVTRTPLSKPIAVPQHEADEQRERAGQPGVRRELRHEDRGEDGDRARRQVDAGGEDDERLAEREDGDHCHLLQHEARGSPPTGTAR